MKTRLWLRFPISAQDAILPHDGRPRYFRGKRPPLLAVWGKNDPFFLQPGAEAFKRDNPNAEIHFCDTGHFPLETYHLEIAGAIRDFLGRQLVSNARLPPELRQTVKTLFTVR